MRRATCSVRSRSSAPTDATVLIQGENGTGKDLVARAIHDSPREARPSSRSTAPRSRQAARKRAVRLREGAFTGAIRRRSGRFELADGGTLFLDEVGDIPLELQAKLLRALQDQEFERLGGTGRFVSTSGSSRRPTGISTRWSPRSEFRSDLYYRLNVFPIQTPPLRDRTGDIGSWRGTSR